MSSFLFVLLAACSLTVSPRPGESQVSRSGSSGLLRPSSSGISNTGSKTITRSLKYLAEVRFRDDRPNKVELEAHFIGQDAKGKLIALGTERKTVELDANGRAAHEFVSQKTRLTKSRQTSTSGSSRGFRSTKTTQSGERVTGCVVRVFADGELAKSWSSDSRWAAEAAKPTFSVGELEKRKSTIGLR